MKYDIYFMRNSPAAAGVCIVNGFASIVVLHCRSSCRAAWRAPVPQGANTAAAMRPGAAQWAMRGEGGGMALGRGCVRYGQG